MSDEDQESYFAQTLDGAIIRALAPFFRPHRSLLWLAMASYPLVSGLHLLQPYLVKVAIDRHFLNRDLDGFGQLLFLLFSVILVEFIAKSGQTIVTQLLGQKVTRDLRSAVFDKLQRVDLAYLERHPSGKLLTRVTSDVDALSETFSSGAIAIVGDIVTLVGIVVMMFLLDWRLTLVAFCVLPILIAFVLVLKRFARSAFREIRMLLAQINGFLGEAVAGMTIIQLFGQEKASAQEFDQINRAYRTANFRSIRYDAFSYAVVEAIATISTALILIFGATFLFEGTVEIGVFVAFVEYLRRFFAPVTELSSKYTILQAAFAAAERCVELLKTKPAVEEAKNPITLARTSPMGFTFEGVSFRYQKDGDYTLNDINFTLEPGEKVALVGPTGSGKSTIVKLMARFYDPEAGRIRVGAHDIQNISFDSLRSEIAIVLQDPFLLDESPLQNIAFGAKVTREKVEEAARKTQALPVISRLENGWDTKLGDRGSRLSAGERQLITFARALARDPKILILDEATSSVDPTTEHLIQTGLEALVSDRTALIIAHRLSTIRTVDRIIVLSGGHIEQTGTHEELYRQGGLYRTLYELQFASQKETPAA